MTTMVEQAYEAVIGIECHVELKTNSKMFCGCRNEFGGEPNRHLCPVCLGLPGALPVPNRVAIEHVVRAGLALDAAIPAHSKFDRKNYFYPDMPKDYQISQFDMPLVSGGVVRFRRADGSEGSCRLTRIHLEEDTGKSSHMGSRDGRIAGSTRSLVDFNRAGVPLMEVVAEPDLRTPEDAVAFLEYLRLTFLYLDISDVKMEEGSLRCDANVSIRKPGEPFGTKAEIKNMNSFRSVYRALQYEIERQRRVLAEGGRIVQETRGWDEVEGVTHSMRSKEQAHDYRYFPDPDLVPLALDAAWVQELRSTVGFTPIAAYDRLQRDYRLSPAQIRQIVDDPDLARFLSATIEGGAAASGEGIAAYAQAVANWLLGDVSRILNERGISIAGQDRLTPAALGELAELSIGGAVTSKTAKELLEHVMSEGGSPKEIVVREGLAQLSDPTAVAAIVDEVLAANAKSVADFKAGKENALKALVGQVMKTSKGKANPQMAERLLRDRLTGS
ncbi:MAG TPA: Asp-tRNA(Asn)/Glu-tRNA(Gln) amidotransferase subunit GatB [Candidatus Dormibacteraeota bacterium]|nr:Asp-tRNA(Asn)/Glu-tRNA(Gln) amidotransferase subunit GatB [Candidatus Dormibacteraeota bacterium]